MATPSVAIIGGGFAGICMAIQLKKTGIHSFVIYEKEARMGGTWRDNIYPGAACDVPSMVYSFSFEPRHDWPHVYSEQPEIHRYLENCIDKYGLRPHIRLKSEVESARFDAATNLWRVKTKAGEESDVNIVVTSTGQLNLPHIPNFPGLDTFAGTLFHSSRWNHDHDLTGKRVAVIGNGASAIQFIPHVARVAKDLLVFQRSPNWLIPHIPGNRAYRPWEKWAFRHVPLYARLHRVLIYWFYEARWPVFARNSMFGKILEWAALIYMRSQVSDPQLRKKLTPDYPIGCKRIQLSTEYYKTLTRPNVHLDTGNIAHITKDSVVTQDGIAHAVDAIIIATGFEAHRFLAPMEIAGAGGRKLSEEWRDGAEAYLGLAVSGFPNFFLIYGPNSNLGHNSVLIMIEAQVRYIMQCVKQLQDKPHNLLNVRPEVQAKYNEWLQRKLGTKVWAGGCTSWYKTAKGKIQNNWAGSTVAYMRLTRRRDPADFQ